MKTRIFILLAFFLCGSVSVWAQRYIEISARMEMTSYRGDQADHPRTRTGMFVCTVGTDAWRIENSFYPDEKYYYDGTNIYQSLQSTNPNITIYVWSTQDGHPLGDTYANIPWLAYCSGAYLKRPGRLVPLPCEVSLHHTRDRFAYTDKTEVFDDELGLPKKVELFTSKALYLASENDFDREAFFGDRYTDWVKRTAEKLQDGVLMFHYTVTESTNYQGMALPTKFEFFQNGRKYEQNGDWYTRANVRVTSIRTVPKPKGLFNPALPQSIVDWRFRDEANRMAGFIYTTTNDYVLPVTDPVLQLEFTLHVQKMKAHQRAAAQKTNNVAKP